MKKITNALGVGLLVIACPTFADLPVEENLSFLYGDESFVSIATGRKQLISRAPAVASVITSDDIRRIGARDLDEVLETVPGLHVSVRSAGYNSVYTMRGISSAFNPQILMLVNGIPLTNLLFGNRGEVWAGMPVENISRIEVIRGPGSAVYGADAFAGTINIITKTADEISGFESGASVGSFDTQRAWAQYGGDFGEWDIAFSMELLSTDGQSETVDADAQTIFDGLFATSASFAPGGVNTGRDSIDTRVELTKDEWRVRFGYQGRRNVGVGAGSFDALDPAGEGLSDRFNFDLTYHNPNFSKSWDVNAQLSYFDVTTKTDLVLLPPGFGGGPFPSGVIGNPDVYERHTRLDLSGFYTGLDGHDIRVGTGFHYLDLYRVEETKNFMILPGPIIAPLPGGLTDVSDTTPFTQEKTREVFYVFMQDEWQFARDWSLTGGIRYDHYSDFGDTINPRAALVWNTTYNLTSKLLFGRAFRAPSFAEQFNINNPIAVGNENLDPEVINTYELAFDYVHSNEFRVGLNLFYYEMEDIIRFTPVAMNTGDQTGHGLEWEAEWDVTDKLTLIGNYAFQDSEDEDSDSDVPNTPGQQLYLRSDYRLLPKWALNTQLNWVLDRKRELGDTRSEVDDYATLDISLRGIDVLPGVDVALTVRNLTDEDVFEPSLAPGNIPNDLPQAGRSITAEIRKTW